VAINKSVIDNAENLCATKGLGVPSDNRTWHFEVQFFTDI